jgi:hypothetical protein
MFKEINGNVEFDFEAFFKSVEKIKEYLGRRYSEVSEMDIIEKTLRH